MDEIPNPDDFTPHPAGPCPVDADVEVYVLFTGGDIEGPRRAGFYSAGTDWWKHEGRQAHTHIIAFMEA